MVLVTRRDDRGLRPVLGDLVGRGLRRPQFLVVDGGKGLHAAIAALWVGVSVQRRTIHKHSNLLAHARESLDEEMSADYTDMIYAATPEEINIRRNAILCKWRLKCHAVVDSLQEAGERLLAFTRLKRSQRKSVRTTNYAKKTTAGAHFRQALDREVDLTKRTRCDGSLAQKSALPAKSP